MFKTLFEVIKWFSRVEITFPLQLEICYILPYNQIIERNNQIIKMNNQIFKITITRIRPWLGFVGSNFIDKKSLTLYCLITWNENHAILVIHCCTECQSCDITQFNNSNPTLDNLTQITIALCTYTHLHVDWPT